MTKLASLLTLLATVLVCLLPAAPAVAQRDRVFVASYGSDSNPCTFGSPCKTFQNAINVVAQGGEVTAIDSAGFGTFTISHAVTITSPNGVEAGIAAPAVDGVAITINAGPSDNIVLSGLTLDGDNVSNSTGIQFNTGGSLSIQNSVIRNFSYIGILFTPAAASQFYALNTLVLDNANAIVIDNLAGSATVSGVLDHVEVENNTGNGIGVTAASPNYANVMVRNSTIVNNGAVGVSAVDSGAYIRVTRSTIKGNDEGWLVVLSGSVSSYGDNNIDDNGSDNTGPPTVPYK
jgi:hypothetical protein